DNSFLVEEAYNQEFGVVQHIQSFTRTWESGAEDYVYTFTQDGPLNPAPRHQLSYTILALHNESVPASGFGIGDIFLNYRYQLVKNDTLALAPRFSVILPTGEIGRASCR